MKVKLTFKSPDVLEQVMNELDEDQQDELKEVADKFIKHEEYITVEIDTDTKTCTVVPVK